MANPADYRDVTYRVNGITRTETMTRRAVATIVHLTVVRADKYELVSVKPWARIAHCQPTQYPRYATV